MSAFENHLDRFMADTKYLVEQRPATHPTTHWRRRVNSQNRRPDRPNAPAGRQPPRRRAGLRAKRIQMLYKSRKKKAMREIFDEEGPRCEIPVVTLEDHYKRVALGPCRLPHLGCRIMNRQTMEMN